MSRKGVFAWILALALLFGLTATGWAGGTPEPPKVVTISLDVVDTPTIQDNTPVQQYLEKKYGVKLKFIRMGTGEARESSIATLAAAGDLPDVIFATGGSVDAKPLKAQDAIGPIDLNAFKKYAPKTFAALEAGGKNYGYDPWYSSTIDGKVWGFTTNPVSGMDPINIYVRGWRLDLLKKIGFNKVPETLDDFEAIGAAQVKADPSIYMISGGAKNIYNQFCTDIYGAFAFNTQRWVYWNGKIQYSSILPETKQAVTLLADWYKKGYIDPDWLVQDAQADRSKFANGKTLSQTWMGLDYFYPKNLQAWAAEAKKLNPDADPVPSPWVKGPKGRASWSSGYALWGQGAQHMFSKKMAADPLKMQKYYEMLEGANFDEETWATINFGIKGTNWNIDSKGVLTHDTLTADQQNAVGNARPMGFAFAFDRGLENIGLKYLSQLDKDTRAWQIAFVDAHKDVFNVKNRDYSLDIALKPDDLTKKLNAAKDIMKTAIDGIIIGTKPLSAFDDAVAQWLAAGGQEGTDWMNANNMKYIPK